MDNPIVGKACVFVLANKQNSCGVNGNRQRLLNLSACFAKVNHHLCLCCISFFLFHEQRDQTIDLHHPFPNRLFCVTLKVCWVVKSVSFQPKHAKLCRYSATFERQMTLCVAMPRPFPQDVATQFSNNGMERWWSGFCRPSYRVVRHKAPQQVIINHSLKWGWGFHPNSMLKLTATGPVWQKAAKCMPGQEKGRKWNVGSWIPSNSRDGQKCRCAHVCVEASMLNQTRLQDLMPSATSASDTRYSCPGSRF